MHVHVFLLTFSSIAPEEQLSILEQCTWFYDMMTDVQATVLSIIRLLLSYDDPL